MYRFADGFLGLRKAVNMTIMRDMQKKFDWKKYLLVFVITSAIFGTAFFLAVRFNEQRVADVRATANEISIDILSNETQYDLLGELNCTEINKAPILSDQLNLLAGRLSYTEENLGTNNPDVVALKKQYSLLQIKDYLLMQKVTERCGIRPVFILYFYSNAGDCSDCAREGAVLTYLRETYPDLRVYSFDYNLDLSAIKTLISLKKIEPRLPAISINNRPTIYGFNTVEDLLALAPEIATLSTTTDSAPSPATNKTVKE